MTTSDRPTTLASVVHDRARSDPDGIAVFEPSGPWTWRDLDERAGAIADVAASSVRQAGEHVGFALGPSALGVAAVHGLERTSVSAVLVNPRLAGREVRSLLEQAECGSLFVDPAIDLEVPPSVATIDLGTVTTTPLDPGGVPDRGASAPALCDSDDLAELILATSGTTARPRLVRLPFDRILASATAWIGFLPPATGWLLSLGLAHVAGIGVVVRAATAGVPIVVPTGPHQDDLADAIEAARRHGIVVSHLSLVATQLERLLDATSGGAPPDGMLAVILGGGPTPEALLQRALDAGWPVIPSYGLTETASGVVALPTGEVSAHAGTVGRPFPGVELRVDTDGRIAIRGPMVCAGYLDEAAATGQAPDASAHPLSADGWFTTNDDGRLDDDGRLTVLGRIDDVIISGGEKVAPAEVEAVLMEHPGVVDVGVVGVADPTWGSVPVAVVVVASGAAPTDDDLRAHAAGRLARFKVPARIVRVRTLPRNELGKLVRPALARLARDRERRMTVTLADGQGIAIRDIDGPAGPDARPDVPVVVLLHATLSTGGQLLGLARRLSDHARVIVIDRRGSGDSPMATPAPVDVERHAADVIDVLDRLEIHDPILFGHSFGGVVALRAAVREPERVNGLVLWEPPYLVLADPAVQTEMRAMTDAANHAYVRDGPAAAARLFLDGVAGPGAWERLGPRQRAAIDREGAGVVADVAMGGLAAEGLDAIECPTVVATGGSSVPFYRPIADAIAAHIGSPARRTDLKDLGHTAPITNPDAIATLILETLQEPVR